MTTGTFIEIVISVIALLLIPAVVILIRGAVKWTRTEDDVKNLVKQVTELVIDKDRVHAALYEQMKEDRVATNRRLEFLEGIWIRLGYQAKNKS